MERVWNNLDGSSPFEPPRPTGRCGSRGRWRSTGTGQPEIIEVFITFSCCGALKKEKCVCPMLNCQIGFKFILKCRILGIPVSQITVSDQTEIFYCSLLNKEMKIAIWNWSNYCLRRSKYFTSFMLSVFAARGLLHAATICRTSAFSTTGSWWLRTSCDVTTPSVRVKTEMEPWDSAHQISAERPRWMLATEWMQEALLIKKIKITIHVSKKIT